MQPSTTRSLRSICGLLLLIVAAAYLWYGDSALADARRKGLARRHVPIVVQALAANPEFRDVEVHVSSGGGLLVKGWVTSEESLKRLKERIADTRPPVKVNYAILVNPPVGGATSAATVPAQD